MDEIENDTNIPKGIIVTIIWLIILIPIVLIPLFGLISLITLCPFYAGYKGGKYANRNFLLGAISGLIGSIILGVILFKVMSNFAISGVNFGTLEVFSVTMFFGFIIFFCGMGSLVSSS